MNALPARSSILETSIGPLEYALQGQGFPLLVAHGAAGGFDQGLVAASPLSEQGFLVIAPSRDGYLRSASAPISATQSQTDKYAALLDFLGIENCGILGISAGGPSAIEFALRHAARCKALILVSAIVSPVRPAFLGFLPESIVIALIRGSLYRSFRLRVPQRTLLRALGVTSHDEHRAMSDPCMTDALGGLVLAARDPGNVRQQGLLADIARARRLPRYPFAAIQTPTLAVHGSADRFAPFHAAAHAVAKMPQGRFTAIPHAGHLCMITHSAQVCREIVDFLGSLAR